jgi:hypothetical protein
MRTSTGRYCIVWVVTLVATLAAVAIFDALVDPYDVIGSTRTEGFNLLKSEADAHTRLTKPYQIERVRPGAVILGTSRAQVGLDPENRVWPEAVRPVYNFGTPGANLPTLYRELQDAGSLGSVKLAVITLDFENFLSADTKPDLTPEEDQRMLVTADGKPNTAWPPRRARDIFFATLTLGALEDSVATIIDQHKKYVPDVTPEGRWTEAAFEEAVSADGYYELFRQKEANYAQRNAQIASKLADQPNAVAGIDVVRHMLDYCHAHGIRPLLIIPPYHADLLEIFDKAGLWAPFEDWKRDLVRLSEQYSRSGIPVPLWDFSGYDRYSTETVPAKGDRRAVVNWFWEAGHFKRALGDLMLQRIFTGMPPDLGVELAPDTIDRQIEKTRVARDDYRATHNPQVAWVSEIYHHASSR